MLKMVKVVKVAKIATGVFLTFLTPLRTHPAVPGADGTGAAGTDRPHDIESHTVRRGGEIPVVRAGRGVYHGPATIS
jgi:hypothetical protein